LALHFLEVTNRHFKKNVLGFSPELLDLFEQYSWPGNVRQLLKEVERLVALTAGGEVISPEKCSRELQGFYKLQKKTGGGDPLTAYAIGPQVRELEVRLIKKAMKKAKGNKSKAADLLGITRQGLLKKMKRYHVEPA
jgi:Nif-specific regulatory protein/two-component system response regulator HydG